MWDKLRKDEVIRALMVLVLGLFFLNFLFATLFGNGNVMNQYMGLVNALINLLILGLVGSFFYGFYLLIKENTRPLVQELRPIVDEFKTIFNGFSQVGGGGNPCRDCGKPIQRDWKCCPYCGGDANESNQS